MSRIFEEEPMKGGEDVQQPIIFVDDSMNMVSDTAHDTLESGEGRGDI